MQCLIIIGVRIVTIVKTRKLNKSHFTLIFADDVRSGESEWEVRLIDQSDSTEYLRKRE